MLGEQIGESRGKRSGRRVLSVDGGFKVEVSFESNGKVLGGVPRMAEMPPRRSTARASSSQ